MKQTLDEIIQDHLTYKYFYEDCLKRRPWPSKVWFTNRIKERNELLDHCIGLYLNSVLVVGEIMRQVK